MSYPSLQYILDSSNLVGANYEDRYRNLRIVLLHEKLIDTPDIPSITSPTDKENAEANKAYKKYLKECLNVKCIILTSMSSLQRQHKDMNLHAIIEHLKKMYDGQSRTIRYQLCKNVSRSTVDPHVLKMIDLIEQLEKLGCKLGKELSQDSILQSLPESFSQFIFNFNMNKISCKLHKTLNFLSDYENQVAYEKKEGTPMVVGKSFRKKGEGKYKPKKKPLGTKGGMTKPKVKEGKSDKYDVVCFFCKKKD